MKYVKSGTFTTEQLSIAETITETQDVILIAKEVIENIKNVSDDVKKDLELALADNNLDQASDYLRHINRKSDIALTFVPTDIQEKEFL